MRFELYGKGFDFSFLFYFEGDILKSCNNSIYVQVQFRNLGMELYGFLLYVVAMNRTDTILNLFAFHIHSMS